MENVYEYELGCLFTMDDVDKFMVFYLEKGK